jgi:hypothetical protein
MILHLMHKSSILFLYLVFLDEQSCTFTMELMASVPCVGIYKMMFIWYIIVTRLLKARAKVLLEKKIQTTYNVKAWCYREYIVSNDEDSMFACKRVTSILSR